MILQQRALIQETPNNEKNPNTNENNENKPNTNEKDTPNTNEEPASRERRTNTNEKPRTPEGNIGDELDEKILRLIVEKYHLRLISDTLKRPLTTIHDRIKRLEKLGYIKLSEKSSASRSNRIYDITQRCSAFLIHNDSKPLHMPFTAHAMSFKFPIISGTQPVSPKGYKMKNWTGYVFDFTNHVIRTTPKALLVDVNIDLGANSIDNLNLKYAQLAESFALKFSETHKITIGTPQKNRDSHFTLEDTALGQIIAERGEFRTEQGIDINKSQSTGDVEFKEQAAKAFEFTINQMPVIAAGLISEFKELKTTVNNSISEIKERPSTQQEQKAEPAKPERKPIHRERKSATNYLITKSSKNIEQTPEPAPQELQEEKSNTITISPALEKEYQKLGEKIKKQEAQEPQEPAPKPERPLEFSDLEELHEIEAYR